MVILEVDVFDIAAVEAAGQQQEAQQEAAHSPQRLHGRAAESPAAVRAQAGPAPLKEPSGSEAGTDGTGLCR